MKVAIVKQLLDVFGPWCGVLWKDTTPKELFNVWPSKATLWEMTCLLGADWYVVPQMMTTDYTKDAILRHSGHKEVLTKYTNNITNVMDIPFEEYDVVITSDPILKIPKGYHTLFAYIVLEHWDHRYHSSLRKLIGNYDLFLAHMMDSNLELNSLPQAISFPYLYAPEIVREIFERPKEELVWVDWRTITELTMVKHWDSATKETVRRLENVLQLPIRYVGSFGETPYGVTDPPKWGNAANYLELLAPCRYYVSVGRDSGAGQSLCDAASLGCICMGESNKVYHRLICHPACLCEDMEELPDRFRDVVKSHSLQKEVILWQDEKLRQHFEIKPLSILQKAVELKRGRK